MIDGFDKGIAPSPHKGLANIQNGNISTELGEVTASFNRFKQDQSDITNGTLTASVGAGTTLLGTSSELKAGQWINISSSTITYVPPTTSVSALVVAGGGAGGGTDTNTRGGGGGGAGGFRTSSLTLSATTYAVTVGAGGTGVSGATGNSGANSSIAALLVSTGGGGGGKNSTNGVAGGSGGGGGCENTGGAGTVGQGNNGGTGSAGTGPVGGGGGGAGAVGANAGNGTGVGGNGGAGTASSISGASVTYAGGGGGPGNTTIGTGGAGGGGDGGLNTAVAGSANTGGGGGGVGVNDGSQPRTGANGGSGVVIISYTTGQVTATGGTITTSGGNTIHTFTSSGTFEITAIAPITLPTGPYYVDFQNTSDQVKISFFYDPTGASPIVHSTTGTATFSTTPNMGSPVAKAIERYHDGDATQYRYYILDSQGLVWVYDTGLYASTLIASGVGTAWFLPDKNTNYYTGTTPSGIEVLDGWLLVFAGNRIYAKPTINLGNQVALTTTWTVLPSPAFMMSTFDTTNPHFALTGHQGRTYVTDGNYITSIFPDTSILTGAPNIQSYCKYTAVLGAGNITSVFSGSVPFIIGGARVPAVFFTDSAGTQPTNLTAGTIYWIGDYSSADSGFAVYAADSGGVAINIASGAAGNQYFNTFYPIGSDASFGGTNATVVFSNQRVNLPPFEIAQCLAEIGNTVLIGCAGNIVYPWNQQDVTPSGLIALPENDVRAMQTVNQVAYIFAGNKANIYITDGSVASFALSVPDYCAGVPGSPSTYIEPNFTWGGSMYLQGRVYFSILDQTTAKTGNCGGIWSFYPAQNLYTGQDTGLALRLENQNSYATYSGVSTVLIPNQVQATSQPAYWSGWYSSVTSPVYGIDYSNTGTNATYPIIVETDAIPVGTQLNKRTTSQLEYKLGAPLDVGATITAKYRVNVTDAWTSCDAFVTDSSLLSGYARANYQQVQWLQFQFTITPITSSAAANTFVRFKEIRLR